MRTQTQPMRRESADPVNTLRLIQRDGVTKASRALGVSTTTLHKARTAGVVAKVVETAASGLMRWNTPPVEAAQEERSFTPKVAEVPNLNPQLDTTLYLIEVSNDKAPIVERFAEALHAHVLRA